MVTDAISHAVLPGVVLAFLLFGGRSSEWALLGALIFAAFCILLIEFFTEKLKFKNDAAIGMVFTAFFALGVLMVSVFSSSVDLDLDCVIYGEAAYIPFDTVTIFKNEIPRAFVMGLIILSFLLIFLTFFYPQLKLTSFDPLFANSIGLSVKKWYYILMISTAAIVVLALELIGVVLVVAFLVAIPALAWLLSHSFRHLFFYCTVISATITGGGYLLARWSDANIAGSIVLVLGTLWVIVLFLGYRFGSNRGANQLH